MIHSLRKRCNGQKGWLSLKLDMSKAYDRVEWNFLDVMMERLGFGDKWRKVVWECISTATYSFSVNGQSVGHVVRSQGLRQGCPLSPYLFLLCAEGFSSMISQAESRGEIMGFACKRSRPRISHLFFYG